MYIPITSVQPGDYALSRNKETGAIEPHRINALLDMGVKPVFRLTTADGRTIRTTGNHPYLVKGEASEGQREAVARERLQDLITGSGLNHEEFLEEREFAQVKNLWVGSMPEFSFYSRKPFMNIDGQSELLFETSNFVIQPFIHLLNTRGNPFIHSVDLFIQPFNFNLQCPQFRSNNILQGLFNIAINISARHSNLLCHLKDTIRQFTCQVKNSNLAYA